MDESFEKAKKKSEMFDMFFDMLAETGDPRFVYVKKAKNFRKKLMDISTNDNVTNEQFEKLTNILEQFEKMIDDVVKEGK